MGNKPVINVHFLSFNHQLRAVTAGVQFFDAEKCLNKFSITCNSITMTCLFGTFLQQKLDPALKSYYLSDKFPVVTIKFRGNNQRYAKKANWQKVDKLEKGKVYYEGSLAEFGRLTDWDQKSVLYFGDQINADLAEPSLRFGWRTAAIIPELEAEMDI